MAQRSTPTSTSARAATRGAKVKPKPAPEPRLSRTRRPPEVAVPDWQTALRRQFGREQHFELQNLGSEPVFSDYLVHNPVSGGRYRVSIRGQALGHNLCTCPDFTTNALGTCKHIEFTLAKLQTKRGGKSALARGFRPGYSEMWLDHAQARHVRFRPGQDCPAPLLAKANKLFDASAGWALPWGRLRDLESLAQDAKACGHELRCHDSVWQFVAQVRDGERRQQALALAYPLGAKDRALDKLLKVKLYPYQAEGALFATRAGRALLGDDMGLGKTIQALAAAELFARHFGVQRVLVVCPTSLKQQWKNEFTRFSPRSAQVIQGLRAQRQAQYGEEAFCKIIHYETLARDADLIANWAPDLVIADEAQRIKNWNTIAARELKRISSPYALVLTGTPLQNRLEELISIVQFVDQHRLGPTWKLLDEHQVHDEVGRVVGYRALDRIGQTLAPVMLRRRKSEVLQQLPARVDQRIFVPLTSEQRVHHDENGDIVARIVKRWRSTGYLSDGDQKRLQCALQNMRMACNSTWLLDHQTDHGNKVDELMTVLEELLEDPGAKAVVFSQWLGTHELIVRRLALRKAQAKGQNSDPENWGHVLFNGSVPSEQRGALVERFHSDANCRLFLSTDAGGVGLNLQHAAAVVVNMDLPWNPAVLEQRIGRVHRMGQARGVQVVNFVGQGSIEEGMLSLLAFKKSLFDGVLDGGDSSVHMQGTRLSQFMQSVEKVAAAMGEAETAPATPETAETAAAPAAPETPETPATPAAPAEPTPTPPPTATAEPWAALLEAGAAWLQSLATANIQRAPGDTSSSAPAPLFAIERDPSTGAPSLRLPLPSPDVMHKLAQALQPWLR